MKEREWQMKKELKKKEQKKERKKYENNDKDI